jgi:hypothetical protein
MIDQDTRCWSRRYRSAISRSTTRVFSAWSLLYPKFQPVVPVPDVARIPLAYPVAGRDREFADFLSQWIKLKKDGLKFPMLYNHWILGQDVVPKRPRWSIIRDVLKWVK